MEHEVDERWEIALRNTAWANIIAHKLTGRGITSSQTSITSIFFALAGCLLLTGTVIYPDLDKYITYVLLVICMQSRLLCNLFDGIVTIGRGEKGVNGNLYNDMPGRLADALFIILVGYIAGGFRIELGWLTALLAAMIVHFRQIGTYKTQQHFFNGPMAKQHRMALLTLCFVTATCTIH